MTTTNAKSSMPISPYAHKPAAKPRRWGGRRPGAGAPKGNLNHLKHGFESRTIARAALLISTFPDVRRLFLTMLDATDQDSYRRILTATDRDRKAILLRDSIKSEVVLALRDRLAEIRKADEFFSRNAVQSRSRPKALTPAERFYESIKRTHPDLYHQWFGHIEDRNNGRGEE